MQGNYVLSFIGFMPADNPDYVMYIAIDHAKGVTQYGGVVSAPIARNVFKDIISIHDIKEDTKVFLNHIDGMILFINDTRCNW